MDIRESNRERMVGACDYNVSNRGLKGTGN